MAAGMRATVALAERANTAGATRTTTDGSRRTVAAGSKERARARAVGVNPLTHRHGAENHHGHSCKGGLETTRSKVRRSIARAKCSTAPEARGSRSITT